MTSRSWPSGRPPNRQKTLEYCPAAPRRRRAMADPTDAAAGSNGKSETNADLLKELVAHLSANRTNLRQEWARRTGEALGIVLLLRDVLARSLFQKYQTDFDYLNQVLDAYEPAANRIANTVAINFVQERERVIRQQQEAIRELSTPVLQVRERLLIVPTIDSTVANHLVQTVEASRLMGASVIITGLSSEIAQTLVTIGVDLSKVNAVGDLQGGIEEAERLLGYEVIRSAETPQVEVR